MNTGIYKIVNGEDGKIYVGSARDLKKRKRDHFWHLRKGDHCNCHLQNACNFYGIEAFDFIIIELCSTEDLIEREQYYINLLIPHDPNIGYNFCRTAGSVLGRAMSEQTKRKISDANKGRKLSKWQIELLRGINSGIKHSPEHRLKITVGNTGKKMSDEAKLKISAGNKGKIRTEEQNKAHSKAMKGKPGRAWSESGKEKLRMAAKSRPKISEETRRRLSESHKGKKQPTEQILKRMATIKERRLLHSNIQ